MKKQPKPKLVPCMAWAVVCDGILGGHLVFATPEAARPWVETESQELIRVRIVPVAPKKRAKAKRGGK